MTQPKNNPSPDAPIATPSMALRTVRVLIAVGLLVGIGVFGVITLGNLAARPAPTPTPAGFGAIDKDNPRRAAPPSDPIAGILQQPAGLDPDRFVRIERDNPHPGQIEPFLGRGYALDPPHRPALGGPITTEQCAYHAPDAAPKHAFDYYHRAATGMGLTLRSSTPTSDRIPGGVKASWAGKGITLQLVAWPTLNAPPPQPPLRPTSPLDWVVQYSYPADQAPGGTGR